MDESDLQLNVGTILRKPCNDARRRWRELVSVPAIQCFQYFEYFSIFN